MVLCSRVRTRPLPYTPGGLTRPRTPQHTEVSKFDLEVEDLAAELHEDATEPKMDFLSQIALAALQAGLRHCKSRTCQQLRSKMEGAAPGCGWKAFRRWA